MKDNIDDLLRKLGPKLVTAYNENNNVDLQLTNESYKTAYQLNRRYYIDHTLMVIMVVIVALAIAIVSIYSWVGPTTSYIFLKFCLIAGAFIFVCAIGIRCVERMHNKKLKVLHYSWDISRPMLIKFREAVEKLVPQAYVKFDTNDVRPRLVGLAKDILIAERDFEKLRLQAGCSVVEIVGWGKRLIDKRDEFREAYEQLVYFGIKIGQREIFWEAEKLIKPS
jgi:hypothetical protein